MVKYFSSNIPFIFGNNIFNINYSTYQYNQKKQKGSFKSIAIHFNKQTQSIFRL